MSEGSNPLRARYATTLLPIDPTERDLTALIEPYQAMIVTQFRAILDRTERSEFYPWIDTKINLVTGEEMPATHPLLGRDLVSGWVQGRGLESIVRFATWLAPLADDPETAQLISRCRRLAADLAVKLCEARSANNGHTYFAMGPDGRALQHGPNQERVPVTFTASSPHGFSDLFTAKGLLASANLLGDPAGLAAARAYSQDISGDILSRRFRNDQPNALTDVIPHGPYMIALGMATLLAESEPGPAAIDLGLTLARRVLDGYINLAGKWPELPEYAYVEYLDMTDQPYLDQMGRIVSDPGHSLEFVGLFLRFSAAVRRHGGADATQRQQFASIERIMPALLGQGFAIGFRAEVGGISKTVDLLTLRPVDGTMPWWSLPETIRAALGAWRVAEDAEQRRNCLAIVSQAHNAFVTHYVRPDIHLMAVKVRDAGGQVVDQAPAYPDADPGYHTALCLIDALGMIAGAA